MQTIAIERETNNYWDLIKNLSTEVKLALMSRISASLVSEQADEQISPYTMEEIHSRIDQSLEDIKEGRVLSNDSVQQQLMEEFEWLR